MSDQNLTLGGRLFCVINAIKYLQNDALTIPDCKKGLYLEKTDYLWYNIYSGK